MDFPKHKVVGLCGYAGVGKDTAAMGLIAMGWVRIAFADALRDEVAGVVGMDPDDFREQYASDPEFKDRMRPLLVKHGMSRRSTDKRYWIDIIRNRIAGLPSWCAGAVVTDVRYPNEAEFIRKELGGVVLKIERPGASAANAEEERTVQKVKADAALANDGSKEDLWIRVIKTVVELIIGKKETDED